VVGRPPFCSDDTSNDLHKFEKQITGDDIQMKDYFGKDFKDLLTGLLDKNPNTRITLQ
jgi:serine/threonine protein kinase